MLSDSRKEAEELRKDNSKVYSRLFSITGFKTDDYIKDKLNFLDDGVVFQIEGYGNYYYTYDCMMQKVGDKHFRFAAFNDAQAKSNGLKKGSC